MRIVPRDFYQRDTPAVARDLLGLLLCRRTPSRLLVGRIVETEAYLGAEDGASHAARGVTARNQRMFEAPGHGYVYFIYGMHWCFNVVAWATPPGAVLVRALEPVDGADEMACRRQCGADARMLTNGPGKLAQALGIDGSHNGAPLFTDASPLFVAQADPPPPHRPVIATSRIGIRRSRELALRFCLSDSRHLSRSVGAAS